MVANAFSNATYWKGFPLSYECLKLLLAKLSIRSISGRGMNTLR